MDVLPPPPVVTITDPNHPGRLIDLVSGRPEATGGHEPLQLPRRLVRLGLLIAATLVVDLGAVRVVTFDNEQRRLDRVALQDLSLRVVDDGTNGRVDSRTAVALVLRNDGDLPVRVLGARVDAPGYPLQPTGQEVEGNDAGVVMLPLPQACPSGPLRDTDAPQTADVTVRTSRGQQRSLRLPVEGSTFSRTFLRFRQQLCHLESLPDSVSGDVASARAVGRQLVLVLRLHNVTVLPRALEAVQGPLGFRTVLTAPHLPVAVPPGGALPLRMVLEVSLCSVAQKASLNGDNDTLAVQVADDTERVVPRIYFGDEFVLALQQITASTCR